MRIADLATLIALAGLWSLGFIFTRELAPAIGALPTAASRLLLAAGFLLAALLFKRVAWRFDGKLGAALALGVINSGIPFVLYSLAAKHLPAGYSVIFNATTPLMGAVLGAAFYKERFTVFKAAGTACGIAGVAILTGAGPVELTLPVLLACAACLAAAACYSLAAFLTRSWIHAKGGIDNILLAFSSQLGAMLLVLPMFAASGMGRASTAPFNAAGILVPLLALGILCTGLAYLLYFRLLATIGPQRILTVTFIMPPFGVFWGAILLGEAVTWAHVAGGLAILLAVYLGLKTPKGRA